MKAMPEQVGGPLPDPADATPPEAPAPVPKPIASLRERQSGPVRFGGASPALSRATPVAVPLSPTATAIYGLVRQRSQYSVAETARRLSVVVRERGLLIFGDIDFAGDAGRAGLSMRPMRQVVFGHPKAGTPLILAAPTVALDLPLRVLIWEDATGVVWLAYNDAEYLRERHQLPNDLLGTIAMLPELVARAVGTERI